MHEEIDTWFKEGCKYAAGVELYNRYGTDNFLKRVLPAESLFNAEKLRHALDKIRKECPKVVKPESPKEEKKAPVKPVPAPDQPGPGELPELLKIKEQRERSFNELRSLHPYLSVLPEGEELRLLAVNITQTRKRNTGLWAQYNDLLENGPRTPAAAPAPVMVPIELINSAENLRKSISKAEKRLAAQNPPNEKTLQLIRENRALLDDIRQKIAAYKGGSK